MLDIYFSHQFLSKYQIYLAICFQFPNNVVNKKAKQDHHCRLIHYMEVKEATLITKGKC